MIVMDSRLEIILFWNTFLKFSWVYIIMKWLTSYDTIYAKNSHSDYILQKPSFTSSLKAMSKQFGIQMLSHDLILTVVFLNHNFNCGVPE